MSFEMFLDIWIGKQKDNKKENRMIEREIDK